MIILQSVAESVLMDKQLWADITDNIATVVSIHLYCAKQVWKIKVEDKLNKSLVSVEMFYLMRLKRLFLHHDCTWTMLWNTTKQRLDSDSAARRRFEKTFPPISSPLCDSVFFLKIRYTFSHIIPNYT